MKAQKLSLVSVAVACLVFFAGCAPSPQTAPAVPTPLPPTATPVPPSPTPVPPTAAPVPPSAGVPDILRAYQDAFNRHDSDAVLALFSEDGFTYRDGDFDANDKAKFREFLEFEFAIGAVMTIRDCALEGDTWHCMHLGHDDCSKAFADAGEGHSNMSAKFKDGKIQLLSSTLIAADSKVFDDTLPKLIAWIQANRPDDWKKISSAPPYSDRALGGVWSQACKAYIATLK